MFRRPGAYVCVLAHAREHMCGCACLCGVSESIDIIWFCLNLVGLFPNRHKQFRHLSIDNECHASQ